MLHEVLPVRRCSDDEQDDVQRRAISRPLLYGRQMLRAAPVMPNFSTQVDYEQSDELRRRDLRDGQVVLQTVRRRYMSVRHVPA